MGAYLEFFQGLLADPRGVSALTPSSHVLAAAVAAKVNPFVPGLVVEFGAGTGAITAALLARGIVPERLIAFESSVRFCHLLRSRFPGIRVIRGDALKFDDYLANDAPIAAVVSGLPLLHFSPGVRRGLIEKSLDNQGPDGRFIQLSYGWCPAIPGGTELGITRQRVWHNIPPAHIWTYSRAAQSTPAREVRKQVSRIAAA